MRHGHSLSFVANLFANSIFEGEILVTSFSVFFFARCTRTLFIICRRLISVFLLSGPTPIHAPRPLPITYSVGIGTSDFGASQVDAATQGGPSSLEMSSFLQDLSLGAISSPVAPFPVSVFSPTFQRFLDRESAIQVLLLLFASL